MRKLTSRMLNSLILQSQLLCRNVSVVPARAITTFEQDQKSFKYSDMSVRLASPERLQPKPDIKTLQFGKIFTDHMLKVEYHERAGGWQQPIICPLEYLSLHPAAKVLHYAIELFEGMKAYRGKDGKIRIFRPDLNMARMNLSALRSGLPQFDPEEFILCISRLIAIDQEWVPHSEAASLYIRPTLIGTEKEAASKGLQQVLWLYGSDHQVTEAGTMNVFVFFINDQGEKELVTPPLDGLILPGITRNSILTLSREWNDYVVTERRITMSEIIQLLKENRLLEIFGAGTACIVSPVHAIFYKGQTLKIPTVEHEKPVYSRIYEILTSIQYGAIDHPWARLVE